MNIPEDFKNELLDRVSLAQVAGATLNWDQRKSQPSKGDYWACCPFHSEKTPSFHVDDRKGFYYCFGCHEKGNAISFLRNTRNMGYRDAIESLAGMVGMKVPAPTQRERERADRASVVQSTCEEALIFFEQSLQAGLGAATRSYLDERGVSKQTRKFFRIGYAPAGTELIAHLERKGFSEQQMLDAGLVAKSDRNNDLYCRFRDRLIFPICNPRGQAIAFGGRAMASGVPAKYVNSPETELFSKGSCLFNHGPARNACGGKEPLLVVEGYMDVVSLQQAGIGSCVAPLGTAVTETQLRQIWRMSPKPVLALDGDAAGLRAAERTARIALPQLEPNKTLSFCIMPAGMDPDDVVRQQGKNGMLELVSQAVSMSEFLWQCEIRNRDISIPEGRAELEAALLRSVRTIKDQTVRKHYWEHFTGRLGGGGGTAAERPQRSKRPWSGRQRQQVFKPTFELRNSPLVKADPRVGAHQNLRETFVLGLCLSVPEIVGDCLETLEHLEMFSGDNQRILYSITAHFELAESGGDNFRDSVVRDVGEPLIRNILETKQVLNAPALRIAKENPGERRANAKTALIEEIRKLETANGAMAEISNARNEVADGGDNPTARVASAVSARELAKRGLDTLETGEFEVHPNGVRISVDELREFDAACDG